MRILVTIPHFYNPHPEGKHASQRQDPHPRINALTTCVTALRGIYGKSQCMIDIGQRLAIPANENQSYEIDIIVCTTHNYHLLPYLPIPPNFIAHHSTKVEPMLLGHECQSILRDNLGKYDYYCFLEDDLILHDPWLFAKLSWFNSHTGNDNLLQPNRYEVSPRGPVSKAYIDGDLLPHITAPFQNVEEQPQLMGKIMDQTIIFRRCLNPHSGCYFLNAGQMEKWSQQSYFFDKDTTFIGPLESAATLGIMKTFRVYKPGANNAYFLEIQHYGHNFLSLIGTVVVPSADTIINAQMNVQEVRI